MKNLTTPIRYAIIIGLCSVLFLPLYVANSMFFPFITGKNFAFRIIVELVTALWLVLALIDPVYRLKRSPFVWAVGAWLGVMILATTFGVNPARSFWSNYERMEGLITFLHLGAYFFVLYSVMATKKVWNWFFHVSFLVDICLLLYAFAQLAGLAAIHQGTTRVDATLGNTAYFAIYLLIHAFLALYYLVSLADNKMIDPAVRLWQKIGYGLLFFTNVIVLGFTLTRGTILGLLGGLFVSSVLIALFGKGNQRKIAIGGISVVVIIVGGFFLIRNIPAVQANPLLGRFTSISLTETTTDSRLTIWKEIGLKGFQEKPILGWGPENFVKVFDTYYVPKLWRQEPWFDRSHNVFLDWLIAGGILGLVSYLSLFAVAIYVIWQLKKKGESVAGLSILIGLLTGYFIHNIFVFDNLVSYILFFALLAYLATVYRQHYVKSAEEVSTRESNNQSPVVVSDGLQYVGYGVIGIGLIFCLYAINLKPIIASQTLIKGMSGGSAETILANFQTVFDLDTFGSNEATEQFLNQTLAVLGNQEIATETKQQFLTLALQQGDRYVASANNARAELWYGNFLERLGGIDKKYVDQAIAHLKQAESLSPNKQGILFELANAYLIKGNSALALVTIKKAYDLDPTYDDAAKMYGLIALSAGNPDLASTVLKSRYGGLIVPDERYARFYESRKQSALAIQVREKMLAGGNTEVGNYQALANLYLQSGQNARVIALLTEMAIKHPELKTQIDGFIQQVKSGKAQ